MVGRFCALAATGLRPMSVCAVFSTYGLSSALRAAAEEAHRQAKQLADEADQQASDAEARMGETEELREHLTAAARHAARELNRDTANGGLKSYNKPELVELAAGMGIQGRSSMTKGELVQAITRASRKH